MKQRLPYFALLFAGLMAWWFSDYIITPWIENISGYNLIKNRDLSVLLGHWVFDQLPRVLICVCVWIIGTHLGLMPSLFKTLGSGLSRRKVINTGLIASIILVLITIGVGAAAGGKFGFHPYFTKMAGDLVSNMYEEVVYRGLMFSSFYGVAAGACFPLVGSLNRTGVIIGTIGSNIVFAVGHEQYDIALRVVIGVVAIVFVYPWVKTRSLWSPWITHTIGDIIGDTILKL
jgi:membrane protease YdiL (CAAX protease family)